MRRPSTFLDRRTPVDLQLTPMIDCVFLLMVYFIWASSFTIAEQALPSRLSAVAGGSTTTSDVPPPPEADFDNVVVRVLRAGGAATWQVNDAPVPTLAALRSTLAQIARIKRDAPVILHPDKDVPLGDVIDVFDLARLVGFEKVQFAASEEI